MAGHGATHHQAFFRGSAVEDGQSLPASVNPSASASADILPTTLEALGDHLYAKIGELSQDQAVDIDVPKLTGILLELGEKEVLKMLQDEHHLQQCISQAVQHVPSTHRGAPELPKEGKMSLPVVEDLAECLYEQVKELEPDFGAQITGMLLEMGPSQVSAVLTSPSKLHQAVMQAKATFLSHKTALVHAYSDTTSSTTAGSRSSSESGSTVSPPSGSYDSVSGAVGLDLQNSSQDSSNFEDVEEELGEKVYAEAVKLYPDHAEKITGMVLEMGAEQVSTLLQDCIQLHEVLGVAFEALQDSR